MDLKFYIPDDLMIVNNADEYILRRGMINKSLIKIDKEDSTKSFIKSFKNFIKSGSIRLSDDDPLYGDYLKLSRMGIINFTVNDSVKQILILCNSSCVPFFKEKLHKIYGGYVDIVDISKFIIKPEIKILEESKNSIAIDLLVNEKNNVLKKYTQIYVIESGYHINRINAINKLNNYLKKETNFFIYDNQNIYITGVNYGITGCIECLEREIDSKLNGKIKDYNDVDDDHVNEFPLESITFILSILVKELKDNLMFGKSMLLGNYIYFYIVNYEYEYNINRIHTSCSTCSTIVNTKFKEQNIKAVNLLEELKNDFNSK